MLLESQLLEWCFARNSCYLVHWFSIFLRKHFKPSSSMLIYWKLPNWKRGISQKVTLTLDFKKKFKTDKIYTSLGGKCQILSWWKYNVSLHMMRSIPVGWAQSLKIYILLNNNICQLNLHIHEHFEHLFKYSILAPISIHKAPSISIFSWITTFANWTSIFMNISNICSNIQSLPPFQYTKLHHVDCLYFYTHAVASNC